MELLAGSLMKNRQHRAVAVGRTAIKIMKRVTGMSPLTDKARRDAATTQPERTGSKMATILAEDKHPVQAPRIQENGQEKEGATKEIGSKSSPEGRYGR